MIPVKLLAGVGAGCLTLGGAVLGYLKYSNDDNEKTYNNERKVKLHKSIKDCNRNKRMKKFEHMVS